MTISDDSLPERSSPAERAKVATCVEGEASQIATKVPDMVRDRIRPLGGDGRVGLRKYVRYRILTQHEMQDRCMLRVDHLNRASQLDRCRARDQRGSAQVRRCSDFLKLQGQFGDDGYIRHL
jgi:hypothetical protein